MEKVHVIHESFGEYQERIIGKRKSYEQAIVILAIGGMFCFLTGIYIKNILLILFGALSIFGSIWLIRRK